MAMNGTQLRKDVVKKQTCTECQFVEFLHPHLVAEWSHEKNGDPKPNKSKSGQTKGILVLP